MLFELLSMTAPIFDIKSIPKIQGNCNWSMNRQLWNCFLPFKTSSKLKQPFCFSSVPPAPQSLMDGDLAALLPLCKIWGLSSLFIRVTELPVSNNALTLTSLMEIGWIGRQGDLNSEEKQQDKTVQKLIIAAGREDGPTLVSRDSFPIRGSRSGVPLVHLLRVGPQGIHPLHFGTICDVGQWNGKQVELPMFGWRGLIL